MHGNREQIGVRRFFLARAGRRLGGIVAKAERVADLVGERMTQRILVAVLARPHEDGLELGAVGAAMQGQLHPERAHGQHLQGNGDREEHGVHLREQSGELRLAGAHHPAEKLPVEHVECLARGSRQGQRFRQVGARQVPVDIDRRAIRLFLVNLADFLE